jgi:DHA2 family multidrug resistance protein
MAITGRITGRLDPRLLIASGAVIFAVAMFDLSAITGESGPHDFFWPLILRGIGLGMMFVPLTTVTLAELDRAELPSGAGLYNFFRQLGGSFGIAGIATIVAHNTVRYHANLTEHVTATDPASLARVAALTRGFIARGADAATAHQRALAILDRQIGGQASVIAYGQTYTLAAILILTLIPLLVLVRKTAGGGGHEMVLE